MACWHLPASIGGGQARGFKPGLTSIGAALTGANLDP
jgi:hypothetical protein